MAIVKTLYLYYGLVINVLKKNYFPSIVCLCVFTEIIFLFDFNCYVVVYSLAWLLFFG